MLKRHTLVIAALQSLLIAASFVTAWLLRFEFSLPHFEVLLRAAPLLLLFRLLTMQRYNLFHGYWRYTTVSDAVDIGQAVALGSAAFFVMMRLVLRMTDFPISIYLL